MPDTAASPRRFDTDDFIGGSLCLDFVNTVDSWFFVPPPQERLATFGNWLAWSRAAGTLGGGLSRSLEQAARRSPGSAARALRNIRALRDALARVFQAAAHRQAPAPSDLALIDQQLAPIRASRRIAWDGKQYQEVWPPSPGAKFASGLRPILLSAEALLLDTAALSRVRECPAERCGWLFLDVSRNGSRRWCSMRTCGNLAKAHRHQARRRRARRSNRRGNAV